MKLLELYEIIEEEDKRKSSSKKKKSKDRKRGQTAVGGRGEENKDISKAPSIRGGETISTAQAARLLGVTMSRIRQFIMDGRLKPKVKPRKGDRDHELSTKDVLALKAKLEGPGRPEGSTSSDKSKSRRNKKAKKKS
jgi:hypothetical protein